MYGVLFIYFLFHFTCTVVHEIVKKMIVGIRLFSSIYLHVPRRGLAERSAYFWLKGNSIKVPSLTETVR